MPTQAANPMYELLITAITSAMKRLKEQADLVSLENVDESTFRSFVMAELKREAQNVKLQTEWRNRVDLLVQDATCNAIVEFKFYVRRALRSLHGEHVHWKGGPSLKNEDEFRKCIEKTRSFTDSSVTHKFVVIVFEVEPDAEGNSYVKSYGDLTRFGVERVHNIESCDDRLACKVIDLSQAPSEARTDVPLRI